MPRLGLKLWSTNLFYIEPALNFYRKGVFDYVELYIVPTSQKAYLAHWGKTSFPFILHAPHSYSGLNFSQPVLESGNVLLVKEVDTFRADLKPKYIIFHPGIEGSIDETIRQIRKFKKHYPELFASGLIENKPKIGLKQELCVGSSPEEIEKIMTETGLGFCLDIGHATCYAAWANMPYEDVIKSFLELEPNMFHLSDGDVNGQTDLHLNFGLGNFDLPHIITKIPNDAFVTIETDKHDTRDLKDFEKDAIYLRKHLG